MKSILQFLILFFCSFSLNAQSLVEIKINHFLDGDQFQNEFNSINDIGNVFFLDRLQYYISGFSITHDGGQVIDVQDLYVLVDLMKNAEPDIIELGQYEFVNLESVSFHFGVDEDANHSDPSGYPSDHALAPKFPSMHWGWTAGYRFIALEGKCGPDYNQELQFHCIGDQFYQSLEFEVNRSGEASYTIELDAEYGNLLSQVQISEGVIIHGDNGSMPKLVSNMLHNVFSLSTLSNIKDKVLVNKFDLYPNPVTDGILYLDIDLDISNYNVTVYDALGRKTMTQSQTNGSTIKFQNIGIYYVSITDERGYILATKKVIVQ